MSQALPELEESSFNLTLVPEAGNAAFNVTCSFLAGSPLPTMYEIDAFGVADGLVEAGNRLIQRALRVAERDAIVVDDDAIERLASVSAVDDEQARAERHRRLVAVAPEVRD